MGIGTSKIQHVYGGSLSGLQYLNHTAIKREKRKLMGRNLDYQVAYFFSTTLTCTRSKRKKMKSSIRTWSEQRTNIKKLLTLLILSLSWLEIIQYIPTNITQSGKRAYKNYYIYIYIYSLNNSFFFPHEFPFQNTGE